VGKGLELSIIIKKVGPTTGASVITVLKEGMKGLLVGKEQVIS
jgi:hypothetical protein